MEAIKNRTGRASLKPRHEPYWLKIDRGLALGYRKTEAAEDGTWYARRRVKGKYRMATLGTADDNAEADDKIVLSFTQARRRVDRMDDLEPAEQARPRSRPKVYTVENATDDYLDWYRLERKAVRSTQQVIRGHILPALGNVPIDRLTTPRIRKFRDSIATSPKMNRGKLVMPEDPGDWTEEQRRQRKATANRVLTVLKAALTHAWRDGKIQDRTAWERVKPFHNVEKPRIDYFTEDQARDLLAVCPDDFRDLVHAALLTGCRYSELAGLRVEDVADGQIDLLRTKSSKPRTVPLTDEAVELFERLTKGKKSNERVFLRSDGTPWLRSYQTRPMRRACLDAGIDPPKSFHILRHTFAVLLLRRHVPVEFVAKALGNSVMICQRHYAHVIPQDLADLMRNRMPRISDEN